MVRAVLDGVRAYCGPLNVENIEIAKTCVAGSPRSGTRSRPDPGGGSARAPRGAGRGGGEGEMEEYKETWPANFATLQVTWYYCTY